MITNYEEFFNTVWDYVSEHIVSDDLWEIHQDKFYAMTFDLFDLYSKASVGMPNGDRHELLTPKICARVIESFIKNFKESINC